MQRHNAIAQTANLRRVRTLAGSLAFVLVGAALYANNVQAATPCGAQADFLVKSDPLLAAVRPVDCSRVFQAPPDFSWPASQGVAHYTVSLTFPDGHVEEASTATNWFAWPVALPAGDYRWTVTASAQRGSAESLPRTFTVDASAAAFTKHVSTAAPQHPSDSHGSPMLDSAAQSQATSTAWTSLRAAQATSNNWDAARRECVDVPGAAATAARLSSCRS